MNWTGRGKGLGARNSGRNGTFAVPVTITMGTAANSRKWGSQSQFSAENLNGTAVSRTVHSCSLGEMGLSAEQTPKGNEGESVQKGT